MPPSVFLFGIGTKVVNRFYVHGFSLLLISRHQFLDFMVNQYRRLSALRDVTVSVIERTPVEKRGLLSGLG